MNDDNTKMITVELEHDQYLVLEVMLDLAITIDKKHQAIEQGRIPGILDLIKEAQLGELVRTAFNVAGQDRMVAAFKKMRDAHMSFHEGAVVEEFLKDLGHA